MVHVRKTLAVLLIGITMITSSRTITYAETAEEPIETSAPEADEVSLHAKKYPTTYNGVDLSAVYDFNYYVKNYAYPKKKYSKDPAGAILYFGRYGMRKGHKGKRTFSKSTYQKLFKKTHPYPEADEILDKVNWDFKKAFVYSSNISYRNSADLGAYNSPWKKSSNWYFKYGRRNGRGNCYVKSGTFTILAREMGQKATQIGGSVPYRSGALGPHSWVEIVSGKETWVYDPSFYKSRGIGFKFKYKTPGTYKYQNMHRLSIG